jgi:hypothetical protein
MAYHMLKNGEFYRELGESYLDQFDRERTAKRLVKRLQALGFMVSVKEQSAAGVEGQALSPPQPLAV